MSKSVIMNGVTVNDGDEVEGSIQGVRVTGRIRFYDDRYYFCQNTKDGLRIEDEKRFGYKYSWVFMVGGDITTDEVTISRVLSRASPSPTPSTGATLLVPGIGNLHHGDYIKVKINAYKPTTLFKCMLVYHNGEWYLNNDKINMPGAPSDVPRYVGYKNIWRFRPSGGGFTDGVTIKSLEQKGKGGAIAERTYPSTPKEAYPEMLLEPKTFTKPSPETTSKIRIRHRKVLRVNTNF